MEEISNSELALLSLIVEQPRHAYEIEQVIEERNMRYWTEIGFSSIYRILKKLEDSNWLRGQMKPPEGRGPARKVYHLTDEGNQVWQQAALQTLAEPESRSSSFLLGLDSLGELPPQQVMEAIEANLNRQQMVYQQLNQAVENHPMKDDFFIGIFFDYLLHQLSTEIAWLERLSQKLDAHYSKGENDFRDEELLE
jgi:DNA-binding PadR family transcriptional regulator